MIKTKQELAHQYEVHPRTLRRWLKKHQIILPREYLKPKDVEKIYAIFGKPPATKTAMGSVEAIETKFKNQ